MNIIGNLLLTGTSIAPVFFVYAIASAFGKDFCAAAVFAVLGAFLFIAGYSLLAHFRKVLEESTFRFCSIEVVDRESIGLLVLYVLPLFRIKFSELDPLMLIPAVVIFLALALTGHGYHFNPLLNLVGWHFYRAGTPEGVTYVLIAKKKIRNTTSSLTVRHLTPYTVISTD